MWWYIAGFVVMLFATYALTPKAQSTPPPGLDQIKVPTATEGREIPVLFGCREIKSPNVVWWGNMKTNAIKSEGGKK
jgi:hypothetical protein